MNIMMKKLSLILLTLLALASCERVIDFDPEMSQSQLVLNGVPSADKQLFLYYAYSRFFLDTGNVHPVPQADIVVSVNGRDYYPDSVSRCRYFFNYVVHEDDSLAVRIQSGDHYVTAHTRVPLKPRISDIQTFRVDTIFNVLAVSFTIDDHPGYKDSYRFSITHRDSGVVYHPFFDKYDTIDTVYTDYFFCLDPLMVNSAAASTDAIGDYFASATGYNIYNQMLVTDDAIDGQRHNTALLVLLLKDTNELPTFIHQYTLHIETLSPDRLRYMQDLSSANSITQIITEPAPVYSNVQGALGIFAGNARLDFPLATLVTDSTGFMHKALCKAPKKRHR